MALFSSVATKIGDVFTNRTAATIGAVTLASTAIVVAAVQSDGATATNVQLDDGAVWVTNQERNAVGRLNVKINELDIQVKGAAAGLDVLQDDRTVLFTGREAGVQRIDVYTGQPSGGNEIPIVQYEIGGGVGAVLDPATGFLWTGAAEQLVAPDYPDEPDAIVSPGSHLVVSAEVEHTQIENVTDGTEQPRGRVLIVDSSGWYEVPLGEDYKPVREGADEPPEAAITTGPLQAGSTPSSVASDEENVDGGEEGEAQEPDPIFELAHTRFAAPVEAITEVSAVGGEVVVLDAGGKLYFGEHPPIDIPGDQARLQLPSGPADAAVVASNTGLYSVTLNDDAKLTQLLVGAGTPSAPAITRSCAYSAWTGETPQAGRWCSSEILTEPAPIPGAQPNAELVWRVNGNNIVLNSTGNGDLWADHDGTLALAGNWSDLDAADDLEEPEDATDQSRVIVERQCIDGGDQVPISGDDQIGIRPRQSVLDVLNNDDDFNCEPIAITDVQPATGEWGALTVIDNGQHLLFSPSDDFIARAADEISSFQFSYSAVDVGGNTSSPATVTVSMKDLSLGNQPPALRPKGNDKTREMRTVVEEGQSVSYNVMADWWDPDGDDLRVVSAMPENEGEVSATADGLLRFAANGVSPGVQNVAVTLSDGIEEMTETLEVTIKPIGSSLPPVTSNDFVTLTVGSSARVDPLANDSDPNEDQLSLIPGWTEDGVGGYRTRLDGDSVEITGVDPGIYNLAYEASDGDQATPGWIRVEVLAPDEQNRAPVAVPDQVKLRANRVVNVDVLANDVDADGDVLAVTSVDVASSDGSIGVVRASVVDRRMVQVEVVPGPNGEEPVGPFAISYQTTDGYDAARAVLDRPTEVGVAEQLQGRGAVTVLVQPPSDDQPPLLLPDEVVVRTGDVASVAVLQNDVDPDADELSLVGVDEDQASVLEVNNKAVAWIQGREVFVQGGQPGRYSILYSVEAGGREASSEVAIVVKPGVDPAQNPNQAPDPGDLVARGVRNNTVRIKVPLSGVDPDGDSVELLDQLGVPNEGVSGNRAVLDAENPGIILYTASARSGPTDAFTYTVRDRFGLEATATVKVMVLDDEGWAPQAHDDAWRGVPGRTLSIPVLSNDSSPQDRRLELAEQPFFDEAGQPTVAPLNGADVQLLDQADPDSRGRVEVKVPIDGTTLSEHYRISDGFNPSDAFIRVTPDPETPNMRPIAQPDEVTIEAVRQVGVGEAVPVAVLANDYDPDDASSALRYSVPANQPGTFDANGVLQVPVLETNQIVLYRVTDNDDDSTIGIVHIPGTENHPPVLNAVGRNPAARTIEAGDTEPLTIKVADITEDPDGDPEIALTDTEIQVVGGLGEVRRLDDGSGFVYVPPADLDTTTDVGIQFEVTDRPNASAEDRQAAMCNCLSTLVIEVVIEASSPPRVVAVGAVDVPQLDEPVTYDVAPLIVDDQGDALTYEFDSGSFGGLDVQQNGSSLTITSTVAGADRMAVGNQITIRYSASDGNFDPVENVVVVTISKTNKGQPATGALGPFEAVRGETLDLPNLLDAAVNPFAAEGRPLEIVDYGVSTGGTLNCSSAGACTFSSDSKTVRQFTVSYTIRDAVEQTANGSFEITMKGLPLAPGVPRVESVGDHQVNLSWTAADMQGGDFVTYHVTAVEAGISKTFDQTGGTFDGLQNATEYHFTVKAENELGVGDESASSSVAIPDRVPDPPVGLVFTDYQDQTLSLGWSPPTTAGDFSAIINYEVSIGGQTIQVDGGVTSLTVGSGGQGAALQNGTDYSFKVRAQNSAKTDNGWGAWSSLSANTERPSRYPDPPGGVTAANSGDGGAPRITVTWNPPGFDGGRAITEYQICRVEDGSCKKISGGTLQATFDQARGESASFTAVAFNSDKNRNNSEPSPPSAAVVAVGNPDPPQIGSVTSGDKSLVAEFTPRNNSGCNSATTEFSIDGGATWQASPKFSGLSNGQSYSIVGRTKLGSSCGTPGQTYVSGISNSTSQTPYGPLVDPSISVSGGGSTTITWTWDHRRADDGRPGWNAALSGDCGNQDITGQPTGSVSKTYPRDGRNVNCTITVSAPGLSVRSSSAAAKVQTPPPPPPPKKVTIGNAGAYAPGSNWVWLTMENFAANASYRVVCDATDEPSFWSETVRTDGNGYYHDAFLCYTDTNVTVIVDGVRSNTYNYP